ncbi:hypothetical protein BEWA_043110 [Theileria equi strain WA]|uniref:Uncharacterized protein n=1 Tax=Theileria equi strain WA TaxID=1537102 RepID=L1LGA5_THEEQ|nr:hypothetical protein BEWA_043110 [Theileria equi strain WA]EKX74270.1 hypothetical protein BEWA_043110 [Theileria equi strain WA]|eukprot:XP_004833722.1 hypothetical protein BEWA_043110 [Theileria equi strain WA]
MSNFTCMGLSLILNSLKCLETPNYDIIDLVANQICLNMDKANMQDITLIANSLSYFHIYHLRFWNSLSSSLSLRHHQITPLQSSLLVAAMAKLDIRLYRVPFILGILKSKLYPSVDKNELPSNLLTLVMHSFAKLEFDARNFYSLCVSSFGNILLERPEQVDGQSHVLFLYASVCLLEPEHQIVENSLRYISTKSEYLNNYKTIKLKAVVDFLDYKYPDFVNNLDEKLKSFINTLKSTKTKKVDEIDMILCDRLKENFLDGPLKSQDYWKRVELNIKEMYSLITFMLTYT